MKPAVEPRQLLDGKLFGAQARFRQRVDDLPAVSPGQVVAQRLAFIPETEAGDSTVAVGPLPQPLQPTRWQPAQTPMAQVPACRIRSQKRPGPRRRCRQ
jgi:hypothetical protein